MDRLTEFHGGIWGMSTKAVETGYDRYSVFSKLAEFENLEVTPEQIREIDKLYAEKCRELADAEPYMRLAEKMNLCDLVRENQRLVKELAYMSASQAVFKKEFNGYRKAEENGLLLRLPCKIGDTVYVIPSKVNYKLNILNRHEENNRVYEQKVEEIRLCHDGQYLLVTCDGVCGVVSDFYKENWFLSREEAESKLAEMEGKHE